MARTLFRSVSKMPLSVRLGVCLIATVGISVTMQCSPVGAQAGDQGGGWNRQAGGSGGFGGGGHHGGGHHIPGMREVSQLPDLTPAQKKQIGAIYSQERQALEALRSEQESGNGSAGSGGGGGFQAARGQFRAKRAETWEKVKPLLTPQQLEELKNMQVQGGGSPSASAGGARDSGRQAGAPQASGDSKPESDSE